MTPPTAAPQQFKQPSRKGKRAWRKNVDLSEIDSGLTNLRNELIQGGVLAEKPADQLFALDTAGDAALPKSLAHRHRAAAAAAKPLKAEQILGQRSAIPAVDSRKRSNVTDGVLEPRSKRHRTPFVRATELERLRRVGQGSNSQSQSQGGDAEGAITHDPWAEYEIAGTEVAGGFIEPPRPVREPSTLKTNPVSLLAGAKAAPAVARPKPGTSYNPSFGDWDALLAAAGEKEVAAEVQRRAAAQRKEELKALVAAAQKEGDGDETDGAESAWEGIESEYEDAGAVAKAKKRKIKTQAERNRIRRRKEAEREEKLRLRGRKLEEQAGSVKKIAKELRRQESQKKSAKACVEAEGSDAEDVDDERLRRTLKKNMLPPKSLELMLPDELQDSLRRLRPEGNLLRERFRTAVVRGHVEPRKPVVQPRKPRRYMVEKWSYRDFPVVV